MIYNYLSNNITSQDSPFTCNMYKKQKEKPRPKRFSSVKDFMHFYFLIGNQRFYCMKMDIMLTMVNTLTYPRKKIKYRLKLP